MALSISYHLGAEVQVPYLNGTGSEVVDRCIRASTRQQKSEDVELNIEIDYVHLLVMIPPKITVSDFIGTVKGRIAIRVFNKFHKLKRKPYRGNHFWARGYCVDTVGLDGSRIHAYVQYQEKRERETEYPCPSEGKVNLSPFRGLSTSPQGEDFLLLQYSMVSV